MNTFYPVVKVKRMNPDAPMPVYAHDGDAGFDLCVTRDATLKPGETKILGTGIATSIPKGCVGMVFPRSGLGSRGLTLSNCCGIIDSGYRGEICAPLHNNHPRMGIIRRIVARLRGENDGTMSVKAGERVCQMLVMPYGQATLVEADELDDTERGEGGFGSTGRGRL